MRAYRLAYDGTGYRGFQRQPHGETVEDALFGALRDLDVAFEDGSPVGYTAAGRTDAGVSARAQTVAFEAPEWLRTRAFDAELPTDVRAWAVAAVDADFHATRDAAARTYRYFLYAPDAADDRAAAACERLSGCHEFADFTPDEEGTVRDVAVSVAREGPFLNIDIRAGGFPREFVRRLVTAVEAVARGRRELAFLDRSLGPAPLEGPEGIAPAAPEPLVLADVAYASVAFEMDDPAVAGAREVFTERRRGRLAAARVAGSLASLGP